MNQVALTATLIKLGDEYDFIILDEIVRKMNLKEGVPVTLTILNDKVKK